MKKKNMLIIKCDSSGVLYDLNGWLFYSSNYYDYICHSSNKAVCNDNFDKYFHSGDATSYFKGKKYAKSTHSSILCLSFDKFYF